MVTGMTDLNKSNNFCFLNLFLSPHSFKLLCFYNLNLLQPDQNMVHCCARCHLITSLFPLMTAFFVITD